MIKIKTGMIKTTTWIIKIRTRMIKTTTWKIKTTTRKLKITPWMIKNNNLDDKIKNPDVREVQPGYFWY